MLAGVASDHVNTPAPSPRGGKAFGPTAVATPANAVTVARIFGTAVVIVLIVFERWWPAFAVYAVVAASDFLDGYMARREGATRSGAFLDPLADKFLVGGVLITLAVEQIVWWLPVVLILVREVVISAFRFYAVKRGASVPASVLGKLKTMITLIAIGLFLIPYAGVRDVALVILWIAVGVTWVSGIDYLVRAQQLIREGQGGGAQGAGGSHAGRGSGEDARAS